MFIGRIIGALLGWFALKGFFGLLIGFLAGWYFDKAMQKTLGENRQSPAANARIQPLFMQLLFTTMGRLAKSDGRVSEEEISHAETIIRQMGLDSAGRQQAIDWFKQGVQNADLEALLTEFAALSRGRLQLRRALLEMLLQQALVDGDIHQNEEQLLIHVAAALGVPAAAFKLLLQQLKGQQNFHQHYRQSAQATQKDVLAEAYQALGVKPEDSDAVIKKAYRKLMSEHHPDKLIAQGLPEAAIKQATERSQVIQQAYETIKKSRQVS